MSGISPASLQYQEEHLYADKTPGLKAVYFLGLFLSVLSVALRIVSRRLARAPLKADDWTIIVAVVLMIGLEATNLVGVYDLGFGRHVVLNGAAKVESWLRGLYIYIIFYNFVILLIKNSILLLYHRIFVVPAFQRVVKFCIAFMVLYQISTLVVDIWPCSPIRGFWDTSIKARCVDQVKYFVASASINVFTDVTILLLPMPMVWRLQISLRQKLILCGIFLIGGLVCITTIMRIVSYYQIDYNDVTWSFVNNSYWTNAEVPLSVMCACLPTLRPLVRNLSKRRTGYDSAGRLVGDSANAHSSKGSKQRQQMDSTSNESSNHVLGPASDARYMNQGPEKWDLNGLEQGLPLAGIDADKDDEVPERRP